MPGFQCLTSDFSFQRTAGSSHLVVTLKQQTAFIALTQVCYSGKTWVESDLLDFLCSSQEEVNDPVGNHTVREALDDVIKPPPQV